MKARELFEKDKFEDALKIYTEALSDITNKEKISVVYFNIAACHFMLLKYNLSEENYTKAIAEKYPEPDVFFNLAEAKMAQGKYAEALNGYKKFLKEITGDKTTIKRIKTCEWMLNRKNETQRYETYCEAEINTAADESCPQFPAEKNQELLISSVQNGKRIFFLFEENEKGFWTEKEKIPADSIGCASLNSAKNKIYFSKIKNVKGKPVSRIFSAEKKDGKWDFAKALEINVIAINEFTSMEMPAISIDEKLLVFASDMQGGFGCRDLWFTTYSERKKAWREPTNLGNLINTDGDEAFPFLLENGDLYFSSDGEVGLGGYDIFKANYVGNEQWNIPQNLNEPVNSYRDDFGIVFEAKKDRGYFSSARAGGKGGSDIYRFSIPTAMLAIAGKVTDGETSHPFENIEISLEGSDGSSVKTFSASDGSYQFENHPENSRKRFVKESVSYKVSAAKENYFDILQTRATKGTENDSVFLHHFTLQKKHQLSAKLINHKKLPLNNVKIFLRDTTDAILQTIVAGEQGEFSFNNIDASRKYIIEIEKKKNERVFLAVKKGLVFGEFRKGGKGTFQFEFLPGSIYKLNALNDESDALVMDILGKLQYTHQKLALTNQQARLLNADDEMQQTTTTDEFGDFTFIGIDANKKYSIELAENASLKNENIFLARQNGVTVGEFAKNRFGYFHFELLPGDVVKLGLIELNDEPLAIVEELINNSEKEFFVAANIYYATNSAEITQGAKENLDKVVDLLKKYENFTLELLAHTDSRGDVKKNLELSEKRARSAVQYIVSKGIGEIRISGKGLGESHLLNRCRDGVNCSEKEHELNRRTEFHFTKNQ